MKKTFITTIAAFAMASAVFAQNADKDEAWAAKAAAKAAKAQMAADLKAFKQKQKEDLAAFIEAQKSGKTNEEFSIEKPALVTDGDSIAYLFGVMQSNGLLPYAKSQLGVDETFINKFAEGIMAGASVDANDKEAAAMRSGQQIGSQVINMAESLKKDYYAADPDGVIDPKIVANALVAAMLGKSEMTAEEAANQVNTIMEARKMANMEALYGPNREAGERFLAENKTKDGVVTLPSGLQYKILTAGNGAKPTESDKVKVHYEGRLIDGTVFDSSIKRGEPSKFGVTQVIRGWTEALQLMPVGSKWELYIPYELAYGDRDTGNIKPYSALIFNVELIDIEK